METGPLYPTPTRATSTAVPSSTALTPSSAPTTTPAAEQAPPGNGKKIPYTGKPTENPNDRVIPGKMRSDREEIPEGYTKEDADKAEIAEAKIIAASRARNARSSFSPTNAVAAAAPTDCMNYWPALDFYVCGEIRVKYDSLGGPLSFLLLPTTNELVNPDGFGRRNHFQNGPIYWSAATGAHPVVNHFHQKWDEYGYEAGWLGYPKTDEVVLNGGRLQDFQGATIYWSPLTGAHPVGGAIRDKWAQTGWEGGFLGYPTTDEIWVGSNGQGRMNRFERGVIYWSPPTGAYPVSGIILAEWSESGYESGPYGYPTSDERAGNPGRIQDFQNGIIDFGTASSISQPLYDCQLNVSWPEKSNSTYSVGSQVTANCTDPKKKIEAVATWFIKPSGGNEVKTDAYTQSATQPVNNVKSFNQWLVSSCRDGTWRARVTFNITNADGGIMSATHRTEPIAITDCKSLPPDCPDSMSQADCNATIATWVYAREHNGAARPGYAGTAVFENNLGHLPPPVGQYREYDVYPPGSDGKRTAERLVIDDGDPIFGKLWFTKDHYKTPEGWTGFNFR